MKFTVRNRIECDEATFWITYFDDAYVERMFREALGCADVAIEAKAGDIGSRLTRTLRSVQTFDAPGPVKKLLGEQVTTVEEGTFDGAAKVWTFKHTPSKMPDKLKVGGVMHLEPAGDGAVEWVFEMDVSAKVFGVGALIEKFMEKQTRDSQAKAAAFTNAYLAG